MEIFDLKIDILSLVLLGTFILCLLIQLFYYLCFYMRVPVFKGYKEKAGKLPVSVIICAKNEAENLRKNLPTILEQDYSEYEVVVVDDCSSDDTELVLRQFKEKYPRLKTTQIKQDDKFSHGKKLALTIGIKAATYEWLVMTDADCYVKSKMWLANIEQNFTDDAQVVLGYGKYEPRKGFLDKIIRYDTFFIALQYFSFARAGVPYMGVGRNLAYRKSLFFKNRGFATHAQVLSGDDDLFINEVAKKSNTRIEISPESHTYSIPEESFNDWTNQKKRHFTTSKFYKTKHKVLLGLEVVSRSLFYISFALLLCFKVFLLYVIGAFILRLILQFTIFKNSMKHLGEKKLLLFSLLLDIFMPYIQLSIILVNSVTSNRNRWK
ncbi:MAG: glycosyltransferase [Bacteroidota bacterium]|nr:glycosyltransferase [Bacteroidota bacterium]